MWTIASDIDGTLTGDDQALSRLAGRIALFQAQGGVFVLITGRSYGQVLMGLVDEGLPMPDAIITQVGTEIYLPPFSLDAQPVASWREKLEAEFNRQQAVAFIEHQADWSLQGGRGNTALKASWWYQGRASAQDAAQRVMDAVADSGLPYRVVWSSGRDLDILPRSAGKSHALEHLLSILKRSQDSCVVAGDTGNDLDMIAHFKHAIVVANAQTELQEYARSQSRSGLIVASLPHAAGVEQGLDVLGVLAPLAVGQSAPLS